MPARARLLIGYSSQADPWVPQISIISVHGLNSLMAARRTTLPLNSYWPICGNGGVIRLQVAPWLHSLQDESSSASVMQSVVTPHSRLLLNTFHCATLAACDSSEKLSHTVQFIGKILFMWPLAQNMTHWKTPAISRVTVVLFELFCFVHWIALQIWSYLGQVVHTKMGTSLIPAVLTGLTWTRCNMHEKLLHYNIFAIFCN